MFQQAIREIQAIRAAEEHVKPFVGDVIGMDSAVAVYQTALSRLGHDLQASQIVDATGGRTLFDIARGSRARPAMDAAATADYAKRFPNANRLVLGR